jgi:cytochrome c biogenesis protein CcmG/thiol:disulfide interchange protein DsbE
MQKRYLLPLAIFLLLAAVLGLGLNLNPRLVPSPLIDKPIPAFVAPVLTDVDQTLSHTDITGEVALVNVFASWCVPCLDEHPLLLALARAGAVPIYGLNYKNAREDANDWLAQHGNPYTAIAFDPTGRIGLDWGVYGVPETFVIDRHGIIRHKHIGPLNPGSLEQTIIPLIDRLKTERG